MSDEDAKVLQEKLKASFYGKPYLHRDVFYCIFDNLQTIPPSISFLCRIQVLNEEGGLVYASNPARKTYKEEYANETKILNTIYKISKRKILAREGLTLGWEGRKLNDSKLS